MNFLPYNEHKNNTDWSTVTAMKFLQASNAYTKAIMVTFTGILVYKCMCLKLEMVVHTCNPSIQDNEPGEM
jgi:hypothetical protein